jgi:hypothetical protein
MRAKHTGLLDRFTAKFSPEVVDKWTSMIEDWDSDMTKPNPYEEPHTGACYIEL